MKKPNLTRLEHDERLRAFRYHIKGIVEATENVIELVAKLNAAYERDADAFATMTSRLEVEVASSKASLRPASRGAPGSHVDGGGAASWLGALPGVLSTR